MTYSDPLLIPSGAVSADLAGFVVRVDLAHLSAAWWSAIAADGSDLRVRGSGGLDLPFDLVTFDPVEQQGVLYFKTDLATAADNDFTIEQVDGATAPAATDPLGRNAVWSSYTAVFDFSNDENLDRTGGGKTLTLNGQTISGGVLNLNASSASVGIGLAAGSWTVRAAFQMTNAAQTTAFSLAGDPGFYSRVIVDNGTTLGLYAGGWTYPPDAAVMENGWYLACLTHSASNQAIYSKFGQSKSSRAATSKLTTLYLGSDEDGSSEAMTGALNRVAVSPVPRSDAWVKAEFESWEQPGTFYETARSGQVWDPVTMLGGDGLHPNDTGMTFLADSYESALADAGRTPSTGTALYAYGDSWTAADDENTPGMRAIEQLRDRLSLTLTNRAVSGAKLADVAIDTVSHSPFVAGTSGLAFVQAGVNDLALADTPLLRTSAANELRVMFAIMSAAERIENGAFSGAGWSTVNYGNSSGASNLRTTTGGSQASATITTAGDYYLLSHGSDGAGKAGTLTVSQGGVDLATIDLDEQVTPNVAPVAVKVPGVQAGTLTVTFSATGAEGWIDALLRMSPTPPTILAVKPVEVLTSSRRKPSLLEAIRDAYSVVAAEFGDHVVVCDPATIAETVPVGPALERVTEVQRVGSLAVPVNTGIARIVEAARVGALATLISLTRVVEYDEVAALQALPVVTALPPRYADALTMRRDKAFALPTPTLVDGRIVDDWEVAP